MDNIREKLDAAMAKVNQAKEEKKELDSEILKHYSKCPDDIESWEWDFMKEDAEDGLKVRKKTSADLIIEHILWDFDGNADFLTKPLFSGRQGEFVSVRPVQDEYEKKTFLGFLLGELHTPSLNYDKGNQTLVVGVGYGNPAIWVFDLEKVIMGYESWWGVIQKPEDMKKITDQDIDNVWYVQALKSLENRS